MCNFTKMNLFAFISTLLIINNVESVCVKKVVDDSWRKFPALICEQTDMEELANFFNPDYKPINLVIENSNLSHIEALPPQNDSKWTVSVTIRNSGLEYIEPECLHYRMQLLDLSHNELNETSFLSSIKDIVEINLSFNNIQHFKAGDFEPINVYYLDLSHNKIISYESNAYLGLWSLNLSFNALEKLDNFMVNFTKLATVDLSHNRLQIVSADHFSPRTDKFEYFVFMNISHNELVFYDSNNIKSIDVDLSNNLLTETYDINFFNVEYLDLSYNNMRIQWNNDETISELTADFSHMNLYSLDFMKTGTHAIVEIHKLILSWNNLNYVEPNIFSKFEIHSLDLSRNNLNSLTTEALKGVLGDVDLSFNKFEFIDLSIFLDAGISNLNLSNNPLEFLENRASGDEYSKFQTLDLSSCSLKRLNDGIFPSLRSLIKLDLRDNYIDSISEKVFENFNLENLDLSLNLLESLPDNVFSGLKMYSLDLSYNKFHGFPNKVFNNSRIFNLVLDGLNFPEVKKSDFEGLNELTSLDLRGKGIKKLYSDSFDSLKNLKNLYLDNNQIEKIPTRFLAGQKTLENLSMRGNNISQIDYDAFSYALNLKKFDLTFNGELLKNSLYKLHRLNELNFIDSTIKIIQNGTFHGLTNLNSLTFENSRILAIEPGAFIGLESLKNLDSENLFKYVKILRTNIFNGLENIQNLNLSHLGLQKIEDFAFSELKQLENLSLAHNEIEQLPKNAFAGLENLKILDLSHIKLNENQSTLPVRIFKDLTNLTQLRLEYNNLTKLNIGEFSNLNNLRFLNLSHNLLNTLPSALLLPLKNLEVLDINSNKLIEFDYEFSYNLLSKLKTLGIGSNNWTCDNLLIMLESFQENQIDYREISDLDYDSENIDGISCKDI